ncbi:MAG TPA: tetratricopeptide repeat protein, partial [Lysobacter sp.]|nr:tetratricopeptide repeat protein [Lysobacter sp.]
MNQSSPRLTVVAAVVAGVLALGAIAPAQAQGAREQRRAERPTKKDTAQQAAAEQYPNATRKPAITKPSAKASPKLEKLVKAFNGEKYPEARAMADEIIAIESFNAYDHAFAARIAAQSAYEGDDVAAAIAYSKKAIELDGLDNNDHFSQMLFLAQLQTQEGQHAESLVTIERFLNETKSTSPEHLFVKGDALYNLEKYPEAIAVLKQALANSPQGATLSNIQTRLLGSYLDSDQPAEAVKMAEEIAAKNPNDKRAQMNLVGTYQRADQNAKASAALEKLRAAGQFTEDKDYRLLASTYRQQ